MKNIYDEMQGVFWGLPLSSQQYTNFPSLTLVSLFSYLLYKDRVVEE